MPKIDIVNAKNIIESNQEKAFFKLKNTGGPKGDTGAQGPQGPKGDTGAQGPAGASASVTVGSTTTLSPGADATVTNSGDTRNAILNFGIPTGAQGPQGIQGPKGDTGPMGQTGAKGDTGAAATVQVGNTNTGAPGTNAQVTNAGSEHFAVFNFTIPRGDKGEKGATGAQGPQGDKGDKGDAGTAATITVGSTTTTNPGTNATVTNSGTTSAAVLNFGIPRGATGSVKSDVVAELPETGEEGTFYLVNREATEQTATGKAISFTNNDNAGDITDFKLDGETSQNGTPTPDAPVAVQTVTGENVVKICGKNLFDVADAQMTVARLNSAGNVTTGATNRLCTLGYIGVEANTAYTLSATPEISGKTLQAYIVGYSKSGSQTSIGNYPSNAWYGFPITFTTGSNCKYIRVSYRYSDDSDMATTSATNQQLELGSTATAYEPYQSQSYEVNLGKNLYDKSTSTDGKRLDINGGEYSDLTFTLSAYIPVEPNTKYTLSGMPGSSYGHIATYDSSKTFVYRWYVGSDQFTFTTQSNARYIRIATPLVCKDSTQCELGSQATSYAAYFEPIELCKIGDYQDYIYKSDGKWYKHKEVEKIALSSITSWGRSENGKFFAPSFASNYGVVAGDGYSDQFDYSGTAWSADYRFGITGTGNLWITTGDSTLTSTDLFNTWLQNHTPVAYFQLATPTDTAITNEALITQLDNVASAPLYTGVNNITTITPNEQGTLEIKYVTYDKYNQNKVYIWNDTLQQWQIIVP